MATIRADRSFVPFNLPLEGDGCVVVLEDSFGLRFNLQVGIMYVELEMYSIGGNVSRTILMQKNRSEGGSMRILGLGSFRICRNLDDKSQKQMGEQCTHGRLLCGWSNCHSISRIWGPTQHRR